MGAGLCAVAFGSAWAAGGSHAVHALWNGAAVAVPATLILIGIYMLLRAAVPAGRLALPLFLIVLGGALLAAWARPAWGISLTTVTQYSIITGGVLVALVRLPRRVAVETGVRRYGAPLGGRPPKSVDGTAARKYIVRVLVGGEIHLDLTKAHYPLAAQRLVVDATVLGGRFVLSLPRDWTLKAGRFDLAYGIGLHGDLSTGTPALPGESRQDGYLVVLNLQGLGGRVEITAPGGGAGSGEGTVA